MKILELTDLSPEQIEPLESAVAGFPETWQELARSHYCVLLSAQAEQLRAMRQLTLDGLARLAADLARGLGQHLGGDGYYIPKGWKFTADEKSLRVVHAWRSGRPIKAIARDEDVTPRHVQQIIEAWRNEHFERVQGKLDLGPGHEVKK